MHQERGTKKYWRKLETQWNGDVGFYRSTLRTELMKLKMWISTSCDSKHGGLYFSRTQCQEIALDRYYDSFASIRSLDEDLLFSTASTDKAEQGTIGLYTRSNWWFEWFTKHVVRQAVGSLELHCLNTLTAQWVQQLASTSWSNESLHRKTCVLFC